MNKLKDILYKISIEEILGSTDIEINSVQFDSRKIESNDLFVAQKGVTVDGHLFIEKAIQLGAKAIVCEEFPKEISKNVSYIKVENANSALAILASNYFANPSTKLKLIGVTGTNGKTTIASLLYQLFKKAGFNVGLLSTVKVVVNEKEFRENSLP